MYLTIHDELSTDLVERVASQMPGARRIALHEHQVVSMVDALAPSREILAYSNFEQAHRARSVRRGGVGLACIVGGSILFGFLRRAPSQQSSGPDRNKHLGDEGKV